MTIACNIKMTIAHKTKMTFVYKTNFFVLELQSDFVHPIKYIKMYSINDKKRFTFIFCFHNRNRPIH